MKKSICCIALALVMALSTVGLFASCAKEKEKTLVMATNATFPPYEYKDGAAFAGIDVRTLSSAQSSRAWNPASTTSAWQA